MKTKRPTLAAACARYTNRYTVDHVPAWTRTPCEGNGKFYAPHFASDSEWYENTKFPGEPGYHGMGDDCYTSGQTWPHGNWLDAPFVKGQPPKPAVMNVGYLQHGTAPGPFRTESVPIKEAGWPRVGQWLARYEGRWRVVHVQVNRTFIVCYGQRITILIEGV